MPKQKTYFKILILFLIAVFFVTTGLGCKLLSSEQQQAIAPTTLTYWRVWDDSDVFANVIADYQLVHPNINIQYRKFRQEEFEQELLNALAEDRGPDIFSIPEPWLKKYQSKLLPMPAQLKMGYIVEHNYFGIKKEQAVEVRTEKTPTLFSLKDQFADVVSADAVIDNQLYGLPLFLDTMVMYYNKDILNQAGINVIPSDWQAFQEAVVKATKFETENIILQSGTALGTGFNIQHAFDIISLLMMQNGAMMSDNMGRPTFFSKVVQSGKEVNAGLNALQFYADFALPLKNVYCWNNTLPNSLSAFMTGKVGFYFGYNYELDQIRSQSRVNFGIAPIPQISGNPSRNYADYWLEVVSKKSKYPNEAWDFILFMNKPEEVKKYLYKTNRPTAQKALTADQANIEDLHASSQQLLTAATWYHGQNITAAQQAFREMAEQFLLATDQSSISNILSIAIRKVAQTIISPGQ